MRRFRTAAFALVCSFLHLLADRPAAAGPGRWTPFGPAGGGASAVVVDPTDPRTIWIVSGGTVRKSTDGGVSWLPISRDLRAQRVTFLVGDPGRPETLYAATQSVQEQHPGIYRSDDGGATWARQAIGGRDFRFLGSLTVAPGETPGGRGVLWAGTDILVWRSRDGGVSWQEVLGDRTSGDQFVSIAPDPLHPGTVYAATLHLRYKTTDGGETWQELREVLGDFQPHITELAVAPGDPQVIYESGSSASGAALFRSRDGGATWAGPFPCEFDRLAVDPVDSTLVYGGSVRGVFLSRDGGESWSRAPGLPDLDIDTTQHYGVHGFSTLPGHAGLAFVATTKGLFVTSDGGEGWSLPVERGLHTTPATLFLVDPFDPKRWVIKRFDEREVTTDRGATFAPFATSLPGRGGTPAFDPFVRGRLWATSAGDSDFALYQSNDLGATWSRIPGRCLSPGSSPFRRLR